MINFSKKISIGWLFLTLLITIGIVFLIYYLPAKEVKNINNYSITIDSASSMDDVAFQYGSWPQLGDVNFFNNVVKQFQDQKMNFIKVDLDQMKLVVYKNGQKIKEINVANKGKEGSWWETPVGLYKIEAKYKNVYSKFGGVYMPYSMVFEGNYLIHGIPYYPNGQKVSSQYSGGCIRLPDADAKDVYNLVEIGMPVLIYKKAFDVENSTYQYKIPEISAEAYLVADLKNNFVFLDNNKDKVLPIASITKLITSLAVIDHTNLDYYVTVPQEAIVNTSIPRLKVDQKISVFDLLCLLLEESSNEAGEALSSYLGSDNMIKWMNYQTKVIGLKNSHFVDPNGFSIEDVSTPSDLYQLARYLYFNRRFILNISKGVYDNEYYDHPIYAVKNLNLFADDENFVGGKIGSTSASGETMLAVFELPFGEQKRPIAFIVLNSKDVKSDITKMVNFIKNNYQFVNE